MIDEEILGRRLTYHERHAIKVTQGILHEMRQKLAEVRFAAEQKRDEHLRKADIISMDIFADRWMEDTGISQC